MTQSAVARTLREVVTNKIASDGYSQRLVAHVYGLSSSEFRGPSGPGGFYSHDQQQHPPQYHANAESLFEIDRLLLFNRLRGIKGMLLLDPRLRGKAICLRKESTLIPKLRPNEFGHL